MIGHLAFCLQQKLSRPWLFFVGGMLTVLVDAFFYFLLVNLFSSAGTATPKTISFLVGALFSYGYQAKVTFRYRYSVASALAFALVVATTGSVNVLLNEICINLFQNLTSFSLLLAFFCATGTSAGLNYLAQSRFVFNRSLFSRSHVT